jgi:PAS domain S-box-containing protein/putative nucleotidyltransferase with HDIG domain
MRTVAGGFRDVEFTGFSNELSGGRIEVQGIGRDITERRRGEEALRESEEKYRTLVENAAEAILIAQDGRLKFVNRMTSEISGYSKQELCSRPFLEFVHPDDREMVGERHMRRLKGDGSLPRYAFRLIKKDGRIRWMEIDAVLIVWEGKPATLNFLTDITERKQGEEELRRAEDNFRRSLDESPLGIRIVSIDGKILYANRAILDIYGYDDIEELRSTPVARRYTAASYTEFQSRRKKRRNEKDYPSEYEISIITKTGKIRHLQVFIKEILWDGQKQFQTIYRDITESKKTDASLHETLLGLRDALSGTIQVLSAVSEKRDPYTAGHQRRVANLAQAIAQELGLSPDRVEGIRVAGVIHDIGKISIPAEILSKPARLSEIEYKMIQSHAQIGHDILGDVKFAWPIANIILQHHERMDGSGYPQGLKGDDILLESRILAVSDVVEAMASHRPYRSALGIEAALKEIENNKGLLYDSAVVSACLKLFREKGYALKE